MNEREKIDEAEYFLKGMAREQNNVPAFDYELSAFHSAGRSVLQYAYEEVKGSPAAQSWYDEAVQNDPVVRFLKEKRNDNIHREPIAPARDVNVSLSGGFEVVGDLGMAGIRTDSVIARLMT